jgi:hypothetical protein
MRTTLIAALAGLLAMLALVPGTARAETVGTLQVGPGGGAVTFDGPGTKTFTIHLEKGGGYAVLGYDPPVSLRDATGRVLAAPYTGPDEPGDSFRAPYTGNYFVDITAAAGDSFPEQGWASVDIDCMADRTTICTLPVGTIRTNKLFNYTEDEDWFRTTLVAGRSYVAHMEYTPGAGDFLSLNLLDANGKWFGVGKADQHSVDLTFRVTRSGTYYVQADTDEPPDGLRYSISLKRR